MKLRIRKCPNCGSGEILEKNGTYVCMNCRSFFDDENEYKVKVTTRDETEIEQAKSEENIEREKILSEERKQKEENKSTYILLGLVIVFFIILRYIA